MAAVAQDDIAEAGVAVLTNASEYAGSTYDLTGHPARTLAQVITGS